MATRAALVQKDAEARGRLDRALTRIADRLGAEIPVRPTYDRNPNYRAMQELSWHADVVESIDASLAGRDEPPDALDLSKLSRADLEAHAADLGVENPGDKTRYPNRAAVIEAIEERLTAPDGVPAEDGATGATGPAGASGAEGLSGPTGPDALQVPQSDVSATGATGAVFFGATGLTTPQGATGAMGA